MPAATSHDKLQQWVFPPPPFLGRRPARLFRRGARRHKGAAGNSIEIGGLRFIQSHINFNLVGFFMVFHTLDLA